MEPRSFWASIPTPILTEEYAFPPGSSLLLYTDILLIETNRQMCPVFADRQRGQIRIQSLVWRTFSPERSGAAGEDDMAYELPIPQKLRKQGWRAKISDKERLAPPHV